MKKAKFEWKDFDSEKLKSFSDLENYIKYRKTFRKDEAKYEENRAYFHEKFFHYTKLNFVEKILSGQCFLLSRCGTTNDPMEKDIKNKRNCFLLCFSTGQNENIPLWYLYSGVDGQGGCLTFSKSAIFDLIHKGKCSLVKKLDDKKEYEWGCDLTEGVDYNLQFQDVLYAKNNEKTVALKYNNQRIANFPKDEFEKYKEKYSAFVKSIAWYYEKETRLMVELTKSGKAKLKSLQCSDVKVKLSFAEIPSFEQKIKLIFSPEIDYDNSRLLKKKMHDFPNVEKVFCDKTRFFKSEYSGQIKMNLCGNCEYKFKKENQK